MFGAATVRAIISQLRSEVSSSLLTNALYIMSSHGLMAVLGFVFWVIVARFYTEAELGYSAAIISALGLVSMIGGIGLNSFLVRFLPTSASPRSLVNTCLTYGSIATLAVALVFVAGIDIWSPRIAFVRSQPVFMAAFASFAIANNRSTLYDSAFVAGRKSRYLLTKGAIFGGVKLALPLLFVQYFHAFGIIASWGLATAAAIALSGFVLMPRVIPDYRVGVELGARIVRRAWGFSGFSYVISIVTALPKFLMPLMVINILGPEANAFFYIAWAISSMLFSVPGSIAHSLFAEGSHNRRTLMKNIRRSIAGGFALLLPAILFILLFGDGLLLAFGYGYAERSMDLLRILSLTGIPLTIESIYFAILRVNGRLQELLIWHTVLSLALLLGSYYFISTAGMTSIGWVYFGVHTVVAILVAVPRRHIWSDTSSTGL
ncbi:MAG: lipopolysaccharide biosynthesis protein [Dehalococcoidia bacterium]|nr:lipopolysaccharide biosynthesis protein [Dehalococcoidia bacterium]